MRDTFKKTFYETLRKYGLFNSFLGEGLCVLPQEVWFGKNVYRAAEPDAASAEEIARLLIPALYQYGLKTRTYTTQESKDAYLQKFGIPGNYTLNTSSVLIKDGIRVKTYDRIFIRHKKT